MHEDIKNKPNLNIPARDLPIEPITLHEVEDEINKRISYINKEFVDGFTFIKHQPKSVSFFGSARFQESNPHYAKARALAARFAKLGYSVLTGGGPGIMEGANRGAYEAGGRSLGLNIKLPYQQSKNPYLTHSQEFYYFFTRKVMLSFSAEAYLFFPGGFGTLDEFFEIITLVQTKKIEPVPIICVGSEYWNALNEFMKKYMLELNKAIDEQDLKLYTILDNEDDIVDMVKRIPVRNGVRLQYY